MSEVLHLNCPSCGKRLRVPATLSGTTGRCPSCKASVPIEYEEIKKQAILVKSQVVNPEAATIAISDDDNEALDFLRKCMKPEEFQILGVSSMTPRQRNALVNWGLYEFSLGQHRDSTIDSIKFDGRLIILEDGSKWEVDSSDAYTADSWAPGDRVVVIDNEMFLLEDADKVDVEEYDD